MVSKIFRVVLKLMSKRSIWQRGRL